VSRPLSPLTGVPVVEEDLLNHQFRKAAEGVPAGALGSAEGWTAESAALSPPPLQR